MDQNRKHTAISDAQKFLLFDVITFSSLRELVINRAQG